MELPEEPESVHDEPVKLATQVPSSVKLAKPIDVHYVAGKALVWDPEGTSIDTIYLYLTFSSGANILRTQCRLVGDGGKAFILVWHKNFNITLVGSLPAAIKQNRFLGLPILLLPEQITFALKYSANFILEPL